MVEQKVEDLNFALEQIERSLKESRLGRGGDNSPGPGGIDQVRFSFTSQFVYANIDR